MVKVLFVLAILSSSICFGQFKFDSLVFNHLDRIWKTMPIPVDPVLNLDSNRFDHYGNTFSKKGSILMIKYGYVHDSTGIYFFEVISSDLECFLFEANQNLKVPLYPKFTFFKLCYIFDGSILNCYKTHEMRSGFGKEYPLFLEKIVDYQFGGFNMPFVIKNETRDRIEA